MALKLNLKPEIEAEMEALLAKLPIASKTAYINQAVAEQNRQYRRRFRLKGLKNYFSQYSHEAKEILQDFSRVRRPLP